MSTHPDPGRANHDISLSNLLKSESAPGIILMLAALLAILIANSPLEYLYSLLLDTPVEIRVGSFQIDKPLLLWINDGLMAVFFFLIGLELKKEWMEGELSDRKNVILPAVGAVGGMVVPALVYWFFNRDFPAGMSGWAIPAATDIAFALGILSLLGSRVPLALKVFLTSLAIFDDVGAILIIAIFYTDSISLLALMIVAACIPLLWSMNRRQVCSYSGYIVIGAIMWVSMLKSGVHATLAGVLLAMFIPMRSKENPEYSPVRSMEHDLHGLVGLFILPIFAFANAGLNLSGVTLEQILHPVPVGIALGLFVGKQVGIFAFCWAAIKLGYCRLPVGISWMGLYGTSLLCGIGFTMSLFIGSLAFESGGFDPLFDDRLGILTGSILSGIAGYWVLNLCLPREEALNHPKDSPQ